MSGSHIDQMRRMSMIGLTGLVEDENNITNLNDLSQKQNELRGGGGGGDVCGSGACGAGGDAVYLPKNTFVVQTPRTRRGFEYSIAVKNKRSTTCREHFLLK